MLPFLTENTRRKNCVLFSAPVCIHSFSVGAMPLDNVANNVPKRKELPLQERMLAFHILYNDSKDGRPQRGSIGDVARLFSVNRKTIGRLWRDTYPKLETYLIDNGPDSFKDFCLD